MTDRIDALGLIVSLALIGIVLELVRRRRLTEEYSLLWALCALGLLALSLRRDWLDRTALWLGVHYPPSLLLLVLIVLVFVAALWFSVVLSYQRRQIERLIEDTALMAAELRELKGVQPKSIAAAGPGADARSVRPVAAETMIANPSPYRVESRSQ